jgi:hypothetical protein
LLEGAPEEFTSTAERPIARKYGSIKYLIEALSPAASKPTFSPACRTAGKAPPRKAENMPITRFIGMVKP